MIYLVYLLEMVMIIAVSVYGDHCSIWYHLVFTKGRTIRLWARFPHHR